MGWTRPRESVARDRTTYEPVCVGCHRCSNWRQAYGARSVLKCAVDHVRPLSVETSTRGTSASPAHANPAIRTVPGARIEPAAGEVISDFTNNPRTGCVSAGATAAPGRTGRRG